MKEVICPICGCDLKEYGISMEAINFYKPAINFYKPDIVDTDTFIIQDICNLPNQDSKIFCGKCDEKIDISLVDLSFVI